MEDRLLETMDRFGRQRIVLVGDVMLDRYVYGDADRISPESPVPVLRVVAREERLGGAGHVACCLRSLNVARVALFAPVGADEPAQRVRGLLAEAGVDAAGVLTVEGPPTVTKTRLIGLAQHRHRQQLLRMDEEQPGPLPPAAACAVRARALEALRAEPFDAVLVEDHDKGLVTAEFMKDLVCEARARGLPVLVDPAWLDDYGRYAGATVVTPNRSEFAHACGMHFENGEQLAAEARRARERLRFDWLLVTLDKDGALLAGPDQVQPVPTKPRDIYDNTGAGEAVLAMLGAALAAGARMDEAVHLANVAGGLEVEKFGATPIRWDEVVADLLGDLRRRGSKIVGRQRLLIQLDRHRRAGKRVVFTNGCFDLLHLGHVDLLRFCKEQGDLVVVALNSDDSVRRNKGPSRPVLNEQERAHLLGAIEYVDYVVIFDETDPSGLIEQIRPDVLVKGQDYAGRWVCGREFVESYGGRVALAPLRTGYSTTDVIHRLEVSDGQGTGGTT